MGFRTTETHGRSFYGYIRPPGSPGSTDRIYRNAHFFFESAARHAASRNGRTRPRRKRPPADYVCSVTTSRRLGRAFRNISCPPIAQDLRACVAATLLFFARFSSVLLPLSSLLFSTVDSSSSVRCDPLLSRLYIDPFDLYVLGLPCPSVCLTYFCFSEDSRLFVLRYSRSTLAGNASSCRASWCSSFTSQLVDAFSRRRISSFNKPRRPPVAFTIASAN